MEIVFAICAVVCTIFFVIFIVIVQGIENKVSVIEDCLDSLAYNSKASVTSQQITNGYLREMAHAVATLSEEPAKLAIHLLKDAFLSRKDKAEGIMLVEAVEKQLKKKCRKAAEPQVS